MQKTTAEANQALIPVVKAMDLLMKKNPELDKLKEYLIFRIPNKCDI